MDLTIKTSSNQNILLEPGAPSGVTYNLPGSRSWQSATKNGTIYYEELSAGPFTFRYSIFHFIKKITLYFKQQRPYAGVRIAVENRWNVALNGDDPIPVRENQFVLFSPGNRGEKMVFEKDQQYRGIEILCDPEKMAELMNVYPGIAEFIGEGEKFSNFLQKKPLWVPDKALDMLNNGQDLSVGDALITFLTFILMKVVDQMEEELPTAEEKIAAIEAEQLILKDIKVHHRIPAIAKKVKLNEYRLKYVFRHIFKDSIFHYLLTKRMEKAKELLQNTSKSMEEIAKMCGYRHLTSFITAFHKFYNYTPRTVRRTAI